MLLASPRYKKAIAKPNKRRPPRPASIDLTFPTAMPVTEVQMADPPKSESLSAFVARMTNRLDRIPINSETQYVFEEHQEVFEKIIDRFSFNNEKMKSVKNGYETLMNDFKAAIERFSKVAEEQSENSEDYMKIVHNSEEKLTNKRKQLSDVIESVNEVTPELKEEISNLQNQIEETTIFLRRAQLSADKTAFNIRDQTEQAKNINERLENSLAQKSILDAMLVKLIKKEKRTKNDIETVLDSIYQSKSRNQRIQLRIDDIYAKIRQTNEDTQDKNRMIVEINQKILQTIDDTEKIQKESQIMSELNSRIALATKKLSSNEMI